MKEILQRKKGMIGKFAIDQIAFSLLGVMVASAMVALNESLLILAGLFSSLFFLTLIYSSSYEDGLKDAIMVDGKRLARNPFTALVYSIVEYSPTIIITLLTLLFRLIGGNNTILNQIGDILNLVTRFFTMGMYLGIDTGLKALNPIFDTLSQTGAIFAILLFVYPAVSQIGYYFGLRGIKLFSKKEDRK